MGMGTEELDLVRASLRHVLDGADAGDAHAALMKEGWEDLVGAEPAGALSALAEEAGSSLSPAPVVDLAMLWALDLAGRADVAVVLPPLSHTLQPPTSPNAEGLVVDGLLWAGAGRAEQLVVRAPDGSVLLVDADLVTVAGVKGFDPRLGLCVAGGEVAANTGTRIGDPDTWDNALAAGRRALASQMVGAARRMLADTAAYVQERHQYGRAIGSFQTVKHRLSDVHVAATAAESAIEASWVDGSDLSAAAAKALAGRAQQLASKHCQQVQGGIAFTVEHGFHNWVRRGHLLDATLGTADDLTRSVGNRLIDAGRVPRVTVLS